MALDLMKNRRSILMRNNQQVLPSQYQEVERLAVPTSKTLSVKNDAYFITDYYPNQNSRYEVTVSVDNNGCTVLWAGDANIDVYKNGWYGYTVKLVGVSESTSGLNVYRGGKCIIRTSDDGTKWSFVNASTLSTTNTLSFGTPQAFQSEIPMIIFGKETDGVIANTMANSASAVYLYRVTVRENGILQRDYVPCYRISDKEPGLFDVVNQTFLPGSGGSKFLAQNPVHY